MARICQKCDRGPLQGNRRSHSNIATKHRQMLNLQWKKIDGLRTRLCTACMKTLNKAAA